MHPLDTSKEVMTDAANATLITGEGDEYILQNMKGNEHITSLTEGFKPIAVKVFNNVSYIVSQNIEDPTIGEIGTFPSPDWAQLNKQIPTQKDKLTEESITWSEENRTTSRTETVRGDVEDDNQPKRTKVTTSTFTGTFKRASQVGDPSFDPDNQGCTVCFWSFEMNGATLPQYEGPWLQGSTYSFVRTYSSTNGGAASPEGIMTHRLWAETGPGGPIHPGGCDCPSTLPSLTSGQWQNWPDGSTTVENQTDTVLYTYEFTTIPIGVSWAVTVDFTGTGVEGILYADPLNGILNGNGLDWTVIDSSTTTITFLMTGVSGGPTFFTITSNVNHTATNFDVFSVTATETISNVYTFIKAYDIFSLGLGGDQLAEASFSLFHRNEYDDPSAITSEIKWKVDSDLPGAEPLVYQDLNLPPGTEANIGITGVNTLVIAPGILYLYIEYIGPVLRNFEEEFADNYELSITYASVEGEICVPMLEEYQPLHNFYDYEGDYYDPAVLPEPPNPPTDSSLDEEGYYVAPLQTASFQFSAVSFLDLELQPSYDRSVNIIFTDDQNKPKMINSRFIVKEGNKEATIADRKGVRDTNVYSNERWGNTDLILTTETVAKLEFGGLENGGNTLPGGYRFYFVYANSDLQTSTVFAESRLVQLTKGEGDTAHGGKPAERVGKTVYFRLSELDTKFLFVKVFYARDIGEFNAGSYELREVFNNYVIPADGVLDVRVTGFELTIERASNYLETTFTDITTAKTLTAIQGSLAIANNNVSLEHLDYLRTLSSNLRILEDVESMAALDTRNGGKTRIEKRSPYMDPQNVYHNLGVWSGESYELGIVYKMSGSNLLSPVMPVRGLDNFNGGEIYSGSGVIDGTGFDETDDKRENTNGVYRTQEAKIVMDGDSATPHNPNIAYLKISMGPVLNDPFMREITDGFFFVRKRRLKDCQYEGFLSQAQAVPLSDPIVNVATALSFNTQGGMGSMDQSGGNFTAARTSGGTAVKRSAIPCRYVPCMANMHQKATPGWYSTTGTPAYDNAVTFTNTPYVEANQTWSHFSFYTPEITTRPTDVASFFSNTWRGLRYGENQVYLNSGNGSAFGRFPSQKPSLFQSEYKTVSGRVGVLSTAGMQDYPTDKSMRWNYVTAGQDTVTPETFAGIMRGHQTIDIDSANSEGYRWATAQNSATGRGQWGDPPGQNDGQSYGRMNYRYDDFVGLDIEGGDTVTLRNKMQHGTSRSGQIISTLPAVYPPPNYILTSDYYDDLEDNLITMGILARAYPTAQGPVDKGTEWQAKYQSTTTTGYFAITDRYSWERADAELSVDPLKIFDGDSYIGEHWKRVNYKLGIQDNPAATEGSLYGAEAAALEPAGMVFGMVLHSSDNFAIRSEEFKSASEKAVYGTDRSFYPLYSISDIRTKQQIDSKLFYAGYGLETAALTQSRMAVELPAFLDTFPYRILISAPADLTSFTNGYRDFTGLNFRDYDSAFGQITKVVAIQSQLYVIWEYGIGRVFTAEKTMVAEEDGGVYVNQASRLHPQAKVLSNKYGSTDPYSIVTTADAIYGIDWSNNKVWRVTAIGEFQIISDFKIEKLLTLVKNQFVSNSIVHKFYAGYDTYKRNVYFNYSGYNNGDPVPIGSIYFNETLKIWVSTLTFYPYFIFNLREHWYSYNFNDLNPLTAGQIWQHDSDNVPFCHFYGEQQIFEYEFILVDNPSLQKILNNLKIISTEEYPLYATYSIVDKHDYETNDVREVSFIDRLIKRYKRVYAGMIATSAGSPYLLYTSDPGLLAGEHIVINYESIKYEVQDVLEFNNQWYVYVKYQDAVSGEIIFTTARDYATTRDARTVIHNGIIKENILYKEDHFYIVVGNKYILITKEGLLGRIQQEEQAQLPSGLAPEAGSSSLDILEMLTELGSPLTGGSGVGVSPNFAPLVGTSGGSGTTLTPGTPDRILSERQCSAPRDKYIRIKLRYRGDKQVFIQAVETMFTYSFS